MKKIYESKDIIIYKKQKKTKLFYVRLLSFKLLLAIVMVFAIFGATSTIDFMLSGFESHNLIDITSYHTILSSLVILSLNDNFYLKEYATNLTMECKTNECKIKTIYDHVRYDLNYSLGTDLNPLNILKEGEGDCDEKAITYLSLLNQLGISGITDCEVKWGDGHCWSVVYDGDATYLADLTGYKYDFEVI